MTMLQTPLYTLASQLVGQKADAYFLDIHIVASMNKQFSTFKRSTHSLQNY